MIKKILLPLVLSRLSSCFHWPRVFESFVGSSIWYFRSAEVSGTLGHGHQTRLLARVCEVETHPIQTYRGDRDRCDRHRPKILRSDWLGAKRCQFSITFHDHSAMPFASCWGANCKRDHFDVIDVIVRLARSVAPFGAVFSECSNMKQAVLAVSVTFRSYISTL